MKRILLVVSDKTHKELLEKKGKATWEEYFLDLAEVKNE
jgi:hypothetical protein